MGCSNPNDLYDSDILSAASISFNDVDTDPGEIGGTILIEKASNESNITHYRLYWATDSTTTNGITIAEIAKTGSDITFIIPENTVIGSNDHFLVKAVNNSIEAIDGVSIKIDDYNNTDPIINQWEFLKDTDVAVDKIPMVFNIFQTDSGSTNNNVHQVMLTFKPNTEQASGGFGSGGLYFLLYLPGSGGAAPIISINNPPIIDTDEDYANHYGGDEGYYITLKKIHDEPKWRLIIRYNALEPDIVRGVVGDFNHTSIEDRFIFVARNVRLADPEPGRLLSNVSIRIGTRTRAEYNNGDPLGRTGIRFDPPPSIIISKPYIGESDIIEYTIPNGATTPYISETFKALVTNDSPSEITNGKWIYITPECDITELSGDIWENKEFNSLGMHIMGYEVEESLLGLLKLKSTKYIRVLLN